MAHVTLRGMDATRPLSVSRVALRLAAIVDAHLRSVGAVWIEGEVGDVRLAARGALRFTLGDGQSRVDCVWWSPKTEATRWLTDGAHVIVRACPKVYTRVVSLVCVVSDVRSAGDGAGAAARERIRSLLSAEGLFEPARKRRLPLVPRAVAVITGRSSAAWQDVLAIGTRRYPGIPLVLVPAQMQGDGAPDSVRTALRAANACDLFDVIIITRGGGSASELRAFDDESLVRAIAASAVPVVTAIGHEADFSVADAVADCREPTPSAAAARVIPDRNLLTQQLNGSRSAMDSSLHRKLEEAARRLTLAQDRTGRATLVRIEAARRRLDRACRDVARGLELRIARARDDATRVAGVMDHGVLQLVSVARPRLLATEHGLHDSMIRAIDSAHDRPALLEQELRHAMAFHLARQIARHERAAAQFAALDPLAVLQRGYALLRDTSGFVISSAHDVPTDGLLLVHFRDGVVAVQASVPDLIVPLTQGAAP